MENITNNMSSPYWWISVVLVGVLINLVSSYLRSFFDFCAVQVSDQYLTWLNKEKEKEEVLLSLLASSPEKRIDLLNDERRYRLKALANGLVALFILVFYIGIKLSFLLRAIQGWEWSSFNSYFMHSLFYGSAIVVIIAYRYWSYANKIHAQVIEAKCREYT